MKILIAEDDPAFRDLLESLLVKWEYEVVVARDGNEAWQTLQKSDAPRLAILDWTMPGMNGVEICRKLRTETGKPYTYLLLLTAHRLDEDLVAGMEAGADDYLTKPLKINELRVRLNAGRRIVELQDELISARETVSAHAEALEEANRDLEAFSFTLANDILKSLLSIGENAKSFRDLYCRDQDEECRAYTRQIYEKTKSLGQLIGIIHDYFRSRWISLQRKMIDLGRLADDAAKKLQKTNPECGIEFRIAQGVVVNGDRSLMVVALNNLFENSWKHTRRREGGIIEFGITDIEGKTAYYVRDNGTGFDMENAGKLFTPFHRIPGTEEVEGYGIGLATVDRIIRRHGGRVWVESTPGEGATFFFTLSNDRNVNDGMKRHENTNC